MIKLFNAQSIVGDRHLSMGRRTNMAVKLSAWPKDNNHDIDDKSRNRKKDRDDNDHDNGYEDKSNKKNYDYDTTNNERLTGGTR